MRQRLSHEEEREGEGEGEVVLFLKFTSLKNKKDLYRNCRIKEDVFVVKRKSKPMGRHCFKKVE
jgi:hypothetical protein